MNWSLLALLIIGVATQTPDCTGRQASGNIATLKPGMPDIPDDPDGPGAPPVVTAGTSAVCPKGVWHASTGNDQGSCETKSNQKGQTDHVSCTDGKGNGALVTCSKNGGIGACNTIGSGQCEFKK